MAKTGNPLPCPFDGVSLAHANRPFLQLWPSVKLQTKQFRRRSHGERQGGNIRNGRSVGQSQVLLAGLIEATFQNIILNRDVAAQSVMPY